jgi:hypothetical protein
VAAPQLLNVDLVIYSRASLAVLGAEFEKRACVLHCGPFGGGHVLALESNRSFKTPDATVRALCTAIGGLSVEGKRLWRAAYRKEFDVGYDLVPGERVSQFQVEIGHPKTHRCLGRDASCDFLRSKQDEPALKFLLRWD